MDPYSIKSLDYAHQGDYLQRSLDHAMSIFDNLADLYIGGLLPTAYNTNEYMYLFLSNLITNDLGFPMDDNILIQAKSGGFNRISLQDTDYTFDQKANIYYVIYGWPFFRGYNFNPTFYVGRLGDNAVYMPREGLGLYTFPQDYIYHYDSFIKTFLPHVPIAKEDEQGNFLGSFILLAMTYLTMNDYDSYSHAKSHNFKPTDTVQNDSSKQHGNNGTK